MLEDTIVCRAIRLLSTSDMRPPCSALASMGIHRMAWPPAFDENASEVKVRYRSPVRLPDRARANASCR